MRTRLNETVEWAIFKCSDRVYNEMKTRLDHLYSYPTSYNVRFLPMASRIDIAGQIRDRVYEPIALVIRESGFSLD